MSIVPNYYHFVFGLKRQTEPFHLMHYICIKSCLEINQPDRVYFHYHYEPYGYYWDLIKPYLTLERVDTNNFVNNFKYTSIGNKKYSYAHHADFVRVEKLLKYGGVYADIDTLFVRKIPKSFFEKRFILGSEPQVIHELTGQLQPSLCNAWIMSMPDSKFGKTWLNEMPNHMDGSWSNHSTLLPYKLSQVMPDEIHIEPQNSFYKFEWNRSGLAALFEEDNMAVDDIYSIHLWSHLWWSVYRHDFSSFNHRLLNEKYLRKAETIYARLANRFLPEQKKPMIWQMSRRSISQYAIGFVSNELRTVSYFTLRVISKLKKMAGLD